MVWQHDGPDSQCELLITSPCKLICNAEVPEGEEDEEGKKEGLPLMLLIRSAL